MRNSSDLSNLKSLVRNLRKIESVKSKERHALVERGFFNLDYDERYWIDCIDRWGEAYLQNSFPDNKFVAPEDEVLKWLFHQFISKDPSESYTFPPNSRIVFGDPSANFLRQVKEKEGKLLKGKDIESALPSLVMGMWKGAATRFAVNVLKRSQKKWVFNKGTPYLNLHVEKKGRSELIHFSHQAYKEYEPIDRAPLFLTSKGSLVFLSDDSPKVFELAKIQCEFDRTGSFLVKMDRSFNRFRIVTHRWRSWRALLCRLAPNRCIAKELSDFNPKDVLATQKKSYFVQNVKQWNKMKEQIDYALQVKKGSDEFMLEMARGDDYL